MKQFKGVERWLGDFDVQSAASAISAASDIALVLSDAENAIIRDVSIASEELAGELGDQWVGKSWADTVTIESKPKLAALLQDATANRAPRWRQVNHRSNSGVDVPVQYAALRVGNSEHVLAFGRSMKPIAALQQQLVNVQQSMEREYLKVRQAETRHRLLFQVASEAVLIVDASTRKIVEANPAAGQLLGDSNKRLIGRLFPEGFDETSSQTFHTLLGAVRATGRGEDAKVRSADGAREFVASASLFREERSSFFLIRLTLVNRDGTSAIPKKNSKVLEVVESAPDGFVVTTLDGRILFANRAFLDLVQLATEEQARNEPVERWLGRPGVDFNLLTAQLREHRSLRLFATQLRGEYGSTTDVEICAVAVLDGEDPCFGFTIRDVGQRMIVDRGAQRDRPRSVEQLTELVGRVPLKDLVRESTDMIERLCIEAALEITGDNRASAAEILGLSRQSLYAKLRRYGLGELSPLETDNFG